MERLTRRLPVGAEIVTGAGVHFRVWAPKRRQVEAVIEGGPGAARKKTIALAREPGGYFSGLLEGGGVGARYRFRLDGEGPFPDPASRFQPDGPHGPSEVVDPRFPWTDPTWPGVALAGQVIYELHIGTFTPEGTFEAASQKLPALAALGVTLIELMPVADFPGRFGWGYDGVNLFAPTRLYGGPDDLRRFVDRAHAAGLGVLLDVVYNHLGPDGNYLAQFSDYYVSRRHKTEWGDALNFDGEHCGPVRELVCANAAYWIDEFRLDGLRLDATQQIFDDSEEHILSQIGRAARAAAGGRGVVIVAENEPQETRLVRPASRGGFGLDGLWNDDYHHSARVALTGRSEAYYSDHLGRPQELISAAKYGYLFQGQRYAWQKQRRGTPALDLEPWRFITFLENHDQVANAASGLRLHQLSSPGRHRAMTALTLLMPGTPMLFQGQEFASSAPFLYFADHVPELAAKVKAGRYEFMTQFPSLAGREARALHDDPGAEATFLRSKLDHGEREANAQAYALHRELIAIRQGDPILRAPAPRAVDGAVLSSGAFLLRYFGGGDDRLLLVNLGRDLALTHAPEPLLAPPPGMRWRLAFSTEDPRYGGQGTPPVETEEAGFFLPGEAAILLRAVPEDLTTAGDPSP
jgi:maltooligosyltrehalose trehalohydrolase